MHLPRAFLLLTATLGLQGCVLAAAAIPLAAGGAIVGSQAFGERTAQAIAEGTDIDPETITEASFGQYALVPGGVLPEPVAALPSSGAYGDWHSFTLSQLGADASGLSALLDDPASLEPTRSPCEAEVPAVLIDLDPEDGLMGLDSTALPSPELRAVLDNFRRQGVAIAWITDREPTDAGRIRTLLLGSRLDPTGRDPLFVQRFPGEGKQARRQALLETHCVIAIAGDTRADFDDLYTYLIDQSFAGGLEPMIGDGWFIIPTPLD
ncbi:hypothetical protein [Aurantiacibacter sp. D1-12]|uniref:hypothetical protein n=1 Tax=Aurantiacibacter sp. D1-12 TaxID=2993658 RepID=UPI00237CA82F|nr:hypothetical protein [Aurantiacibacter sp. D1-12]MDE1468518.1 hypothetical protein [Aurantiacibacter sp. D1-12]